MEYAVGVRSDVSIWPPGTTFAVPESYRGQGRPCEILKPVGAISPLSVKQFALGLGPHDWQIITWREGSNSELTSRFARARIMIAHRHHKQKQPRPEEWLLIEWPQDEETTCWTRSLAQWWLAIKWARGLLVFQKPRENLNANAER